MKNENKRPRTTRGQFTKGTSGNPAGRPRGSRNRSTVLLESMLEGEAQPLARKVIELAKKGDMQAMRLCLDRILPPRKDRLIDLSLPPVENPAQLSAALSTVIEAVGAGRLTPSEGEILANILAVKSKFISDRDLEMRLEQLEQAILAAKDANAKQVVDLVPLLREGRVPETEEAEPPVSDTLRRE